MPRTVANGLFNGIVKRSLRVNSDSRLLHSLTTRCQCQPTTFSAVKSAQATSRCVLLKVEKAVPVSARFHSKAPIDESTGQEDLHSDTELPKDLPESERTEANVRGPQLFSLRDQTVLVTGGGRGVGISLAAAVIEAGGHVACMDLLPSPSQLEWAALQEMAKASGLTISYTKCDITDEEAMVSAVTEISKAGQARGAPLRGAVACAGIQQKIPVLEYPVADFERMLKVNTVGAFVTAKAVANDMVKNNVTGSLVLVASMSGNIANRGLRCSAYNSSKAAVQQLCRSMAQEVGKHGIRVNTLSPGYIRTKMTDELLAAEPELEKLWMAGAMLDRLGAPEDFKAPTIFLLSRGSSFMTGADLRVDGGHTASA